MAKILVNGGSRGIGRGICEAFLRAGDMVTYTCRSKENLRESEVYFSEITGGLGYTGILCDSGDYGQVEIAVVRAMEFMSGIDILVNNAGVRKYGQVEDLSVENWNEAVATNVNGYFYFAKCASLHIQNSENPWIFNVGSTAANHPFLGGISYNATKAAVHGLSGSLHLEGRESGIRVCCISLGNVNNKESINPDDAWMIKPLEVGRTVILLTKIDRGVAPDLVELKPSMAPNHPAPGIQALKYV